MQAAPRNFTDLGKRVKRTILRLGSDDTSALDKPSSAAHQQLLQRLRHSRLEVERQREELQRTKAALEVAHTRYFDLLEYTNTLYNQAPVSYLTLTKQGLIVEANLTAANLLVCTRAFLLQQPVMHFIASEDRARFDAYCQGLRATGKPQRCEVQMVCEGGSRFFAQIDGRVVEDLLGADNHAGKTIEQSAGCVDANHYLRITISDISARVQLEAEERKVRNELEATLLDLRQTQEQMVKQERLAVVGQLAAGIAHDFNNILAAITLYAQLLVRSPELPTPLRKRIEVIVEQSDRATQLVQQILDFGRRTALTRQSLALSPYLQQFIELLQHTLPESIQISLDTSSLRPGFDDIVDIDPSRMQQVLLNLAFNARDAMPKGGELRLTIAPITSDGTTPLATGALRPGRWLCVAVSDTGTGIEDKDLPRLFEPFFTTKGVGAGSGLGLAQVWGIVKQHDGEISVASRLGEGTTISLYLPALSVAPSAPSVHETEPIPCGQGEWVLVVEDNRVLNVALSSTLEQIGYRVLVANNGKDAQVHIAEHRNEIKIILTDLVMPFMSGEELIHNLRTQGWEQPVIVLSGHPLSADRMEYLYSYGDVRLLLKPPTLAHLAIELYQALNPEAISNA